MSFLTSLFGGGKPEPWDKIIEPEKEQVQFEDRGGVTLNSVPTKKTKAPGAPKFHNPHLADPFENQVGHQPSRYPTLLH